MTGASALRALDHGRACLLITGAPGAGKTTVARLAAASLTRSAVLSGDMVSGLVVSGRVWALGQPAAEAARQVALCNDNLCALATNIAAAGFTPIIDWIIPSAAQLEVFRRELGHRLRLIVLDPDENTCTQRNASRPAEEQFLFDGYAQLRASMRAGFGHQGWWFNTTDLTPTQTVQLILAEADDRARLT